MTSGGRAALALVADTVGVLARWYRADVLRALTAVETDRASGFHRATDADDFVAAHLLAREAVALAMGGDPAGVRVASTCPECGSDRHGAPRVVGALDLGVSLSHARGVVAAVAGVGPLGIDVEPVSAGADPELLAGVVLVPAERLAIAAAPDPHRAFLLLWVRKEALTKAGVADLDSLATVDLAASPFGWGGRTLEVWTGRVRGAGEVVAAVAATGAVTWRATGSAVVAEPTGDRAT